MKPTYRSRPGAGVHGGEYLLWFLLALAALVLVVLALLTWSVDAHAHMTQRVADRWEPYHLSPAQRQWFKDQTASYGVCCDVADGYPADDWERRADDLDASKSHYWVEFEGKWWQVPDANVILHTGNPTGVPVVWLTTAKDGVRCFVPGVEN
jgi:hypothetical protein